MKKRYALISVYDKKGIKDICETFLKFNINIISTGTTAKHITNLGYKCRSVTSFTKFKEILDGRVKTLHPKLHASLLFDRENNNHIDAFKNLKFPVIDFIVVNLYPFKKYINSKNSKKCIEMIDIGGPALLRSSAKNHKSVTVVSNTNDYTDLINSLENNKGKTTLNFRIKMAQKVYETTANYDTIIASWLNQKNKKLFKQDNRKTINLRYGENPHQKAVFKYNNNNKNILDGVLQGKKFSYNNLLDVDSAINLLNEFDEPTCAIIKHNNPCGVASDKHIYKAFNKALDSDPISSFGGIVAVNKSIDEHLAQILVSNFFEIIIAKNFQKKAYNVLAKKRKLILIETKNIQYENKKDIKSINGGYLIQEKNNIKIGLNHIRSVSRYKASKKIRDDLIFSFKVCKHVKSNAIVIAKNKKTLGIGAGQMSRIDATRLALYKAPKKIKLTGFVSASDAFFPFIDGVKLLTNNNCKAIIQPKGSINDSKIIDFANKNKLPLYFSNYRLFKH